VSIDTSTEITALRDAVAAVCRDAGGPLAIRALAEGGPGYAEDVWRILTEQIGIGVLGLPAEADGLGGPAELAAVGECLGAALMPVPFLSSAVLSGQLLSRCGPAAAGLLARTMDGCVVATALLDSDGRWNPAGLPLLARADGDGWVVDGSADFVLDGAAAAHLLVVAGTPDGPAVFAVDPAGAGVHRHAMQTLDLGRGQAHLTMTGARATVLARGPAVTALVGAAVDLTLVVLAAEQLGGAQAVLDLTVGYVGERRQFGRAVGSFQAVKHRCADMLVQVETARSAVHRAVEAAERADREPLALAEAASVAKAWCSDAFTRVTADAVHLHGGIGFTWEHDAHLYFRRARADAALFGDATYHRERLATLLSW
jgi:alkylation response protein AidB-like acyl-CoA dehydrogenase